MLVSVSVTVSSGSVSRSPHNGTLTTFDVSDGLKVSVWLTRRKSTPVVQPVPPDAVPLLAIKLATEVPELSPARVTVIAAVCDSSSI